MNKNYNIETIKSTIDIVDLANRLGLNPNSHNFIKTIYKEEKTPSLKLYKESGTYHCFSTGKSGNIFDLYAVVQGLDTKRDFRRVIEELSIMFGIYKSNIEIKVKKPKHKKEVLESKSLINNIDGIIFTDIYIYFVEQCILNDLNSAGVVYLKNRGFDLDILIKRKIGYVPDNSYFELSKKLLSNFEIEKLKQSGLFNEEGKFKGFSNSIVIPYFNSQGIITSLQFRLLGSNSKQFKYLYLKNIKKTAYGLDLALNVNKIDDDKVDTIYFTEGVFDTLILQQLEFRSIAIPSAGDNKVLSDIELLEIIKNYNKLILAFDNDEAGYKLQQEFGNRLFRLGARNILIKIFPKGVKDVNDYMLYLDKEEINNK